MVYTMKQVCDELDMTYETLRFYCDEGLIPNVKRDKNNYRQFDERNISWLRGLQCLRRCGMSISGMKEYLELCLQGESTIEARKEILNAHREVLMSKINEIESSIEYIDDKQAFYDGVLAGEIPYRSNLIEVNVSK